jgi:acyl-CoA thioesterase-1
MIGTISFRFTSRIVLLVSVLLCMPAHAAAPVVAVLGDSLSAGYGLASGTGWVDLLARRLAAEGYPHRVVNASISGDTTRGGLARIAGVLDEHAPGVVVVALGGNDGLRGLAVAAMRANLEAIVSRALDHGSAVVLVGVRLPPNYGSAYTSAFESAFDTVARRFDIPLAPRLLEGVAEENGLFQGDRIHPGAQAQVRMLDNVWPTLQPLLKRQARE